MSKINKIPDHSMKISTTVLFKSKEISTLIRELYDIGPIIRITFEIFPPLWLSYSMELYFQKICMKYDR